MEEYAYVLDYLPYGKDNIKAPVVQLIGEKGFTLLEATVKDNISVTIGEKLYVGKNNRDKIEKIKRRISFEELTNIAKENLEVVLKILVKDNEARFVDFINRSKSFSIRVHPLELIPGIGKKNASVIIEEREKKPFESFKDIKERVPTWADPIKSMVERIIKELSGEEKYHFFVVPYQQRQKRF